MEPPEVTGICLQVFSVFVLIFSNLKKRKVENSLVVGGATSPSALVNMSDKFKNRSALAVVSERWSNGEPDLSSTVTNILLIW